MQTHEFKFRDEDFRFIANLMHSHMGIHLPAQKKEMVYARLARRLRQLNMQNFAEYLSHLEKNNAQELEKLVNAITTNVTSFFRESHHFEHLAHTVLSEKAHQLKNGHLEKNQYRLRIWSAGCSAGMEAYTMAMVVCQHLPNFAQWDIKILATDIDTAILQQARQGEYDLSQAQKIPPAYQRYIVTDSARQTMRVADQLRRMVYFKHLNLLDEWPMRGPFDAIFCRNVVIYFDKDTQRTLFNRMAGLMMPQGWMYIGHSENLSFVSERFKLHGQTIYRLQA